MDPSRRPAFNRAFSPAFFQHYMNQLVEQVGDFPFTVAETPLLLTPELRDLLARQAQELVTQLAEPAKLAELKKAIPARYDMPRMDALPSCVQVDFALTRTPDGKSLEGKVVELQAFPSLYALMTLMAEAWNRTLNTAPGLEGDWTCFLGGRNREQALALMRDTLLGGEAPEHVVLVDYEPEKQKTSPDFVATQRLFGIDSICVTKIIKRGRQLFRIKDGRELPIRRIYNRMVFDELEVKNVQVPFAWTDDLDVTWCAHPNWYWTWSKFALPHLDHPAVPKARYLSEVKELPADLSKYVLKPLFSFAGSGVVVDVTPEDVAKVPAEQRSGWVLQEKIEYASAITMPDGNGVKAEVRVMLLRPPHATTLEPLICLVRLSRGKMLGVDFNKGLSWTGGSVGIWPR